METRYTLLVVGRPGDVVPVVSGLRIAAPARTVEEASDYDEAARTVLAWRARIESGDGRGPDLVLLDQRDPHLEVPRLIRLIRGTIDHKVAIVVLSSQVDARFVQDCLRLDANAVVRRPETPDRIQDVAEAIGRYWLTVNTPVPGKRALQLAHGV
jgi:CheY-like chemotaxis protein